jgi:hypothetical protein
VDVIVEGRGRKDVKIRQRQYRVEQDRDRYKGWD